MGLVSLLNIAGVELELAGVETHRLSNYVNATACEFIELVKSCFFLIIIHNYVKNGLRCGQKGENFSSPWLTSWQHRIPRQDHVPRPYRIGMISFHVAGFFHNRWDVFFFCHQCTNFVQKSCRNRKRCAQLWNYNTNRKNMLENCLLYTWISLQVVYC